VRFLDYLLVAAVIAVGDNTVALHCYAYASHPPKPSPPANGHRLTV
jgi:hypothetical protein